MLLSLWSVLEPALPLLMVMAAVLVVIRVVFGVTLPGRGLLDRTRDPWRSFKYEGRRAIMLRAGGRCEAPTFFMWGRCQRPATDADHVYPWSRGGPTIVSNGQALCRSHNTRKAARLPAWWYIIGLERRRRAYVSDGGEWRVSARRA